MKSYIPLYLNEKNEIWFLIKVYERIKKAFIIQLNRYCYFLGLIFINYYDLIILTIDRRFEGLKRSVRNVLPVFAIIRISLLRWFKDRCTNATIAAHILGWKNVCASCAKTRAEGSRWLEFYGMSEIPSALKQHRYEVQTRMFIGSRDEVCSLKYLDPSWRGIVDKIRCLLIGLNDNQN